LGDPSGETPKGVRLKQGATWPGAAWGYKGQAYAVDISKWPVRAPAEGLREFVEFPRVPLSHRAAAGFLSRTVESCLRFEDGFIEDVRLHVDRMARSVAGSHARAIIEQEPACA
jgi:DNA (cytosine-5)-methyltransferase 1